VQYLIIWNVLNSILRLSAQIQKSGTNCCTSQCTQTLVLVIVCNFPLLLCCEEIVWCYVVLLEKTTIITLILGKNIITDISTTMPKFWPTKKILNGWLSCSYSTRRFNLQKYDLLWAQAIEYICSVVALYCSSLQLIHSISSHTIKDY
jgi:hypothetical protein